MNKPAVIALMAILLVDVLMWGLYAHSILGAVFWMLCLIAAPKLEKEYSWSK